MVDFMVNLKVWDGLEKIKISLTFLRGYGSWGDAAGFSNDTVWAAAGDPGIIPRNRHPPEPEDDGDASGLSADWPGSHGTTSNVPPTKDIIVNGMVVKTTYENFRFRYDGKANPYDRGCAQNVKEIFCSRIPISKNDFRAKVKEDLASMSMSSFSTSLPRGHVLSPEIANAKASLDIESGGKRQPVAAEEFEDIQNEIGMETSRSQQRHSTWVQKVNWEITPDGPTLPNDLGMEHEGFKEREKISH
ncbi:hypothetical protein ACLOJK_023782 [Asimina triloba]